MSDDHALELWIEPWTEQFRIIPEGDEYPPTRLLIGQCSCGLWAGDTYTTGPVSKLDVERLQKEHQQHVGKKLLEAANERGWHG